MNQITAIRAAQAKEAEGISRVAKAHIRARLVFYLLDIDILAILIGSILAGYVRFGNMVAAPALSLAVAVIPLHLLSGCILHAFSDVALTQRTTSIRLAITSLLAAMVLLLLILFALQQSEEVSRIQIGLATCFTTLFLTAGRMAMVGHARRALGGELYTIMHIDDREDGIHIRDFRHISTPRRLNWDIINDDPAGYHELAKMIGKADRAIIRCAPYRRGRWSHILQGMNVHAEIIASELCDTTVVGIGRVDHELTFVVASGPLALTDRMIKRIFDIAFAAATLFVLLPLFILTALAIKLDSPGPVFFRQPRIGRQNQLFQIYKFRSMRAELSDAGGLRSTARDDDRITRVGRVIRSTSIDELPQLINVLIGDMSIVGPRPHAVHSMAQDKLFWEVDPSYWHRHACKPGITGLAQVRGHRGATAREQDLRNRLAADLEYLNQWSIWLDMAILVRTLKVIMHRNAF